MSQGRGAGWMTLVGLQCSDQMMTLLLIVSRVVEVLTDLSQSLSIAENNKTIVLSAGAAGVLVGHPFDTVKVGQYSNMLINILTFFFSISNCWLYSREESESKIWERCTF